MDEQGSLCSASAFFMLSNRKGDFTPKRRTVLESKRASPGVCKTHSWRYLPLPYQPIHTGIDIAGAYGTPITPFMKGTVIDVEHLSWGYGNYVVIDHGNNVTSLYGHMSQTEATKGQVVQPGDVIGVEGQSGWATGPHVHFQINVFGIPVNPRTFVQGNP